MLQQFEILLDKWTKLSTALGSRDKSVKALQYGVRMILWFYIDKLSKQTRDALANTQMAASNARKLFRLLRSFDHMKSILALLKKRQSWIAASNNSSHSSSSSSSEVAAPTAEEMMLLNIELFTQTLWAFFLFYDNQLLLTRLQLFPEVLGTDPKVHDRRSNVFWFAADCTNLGVACYHYYRYRCTRGELVERLQRLEAGSNSCSNKSIRRSEEGGGVADAPGDAATADASGCGSGSQLRRRTATRDNECRDNSSNCSSNGAVTVEEEVEIVRAQLAALDGRERNKLQWGILKALVDCGVSGSMDPIFIGKHVPTALGGTGDNTPQSMIGFLGMTSALMNIADVYWAQNPVPALAPPSSTVVAGKGK